MIHSSSLGKMKTLLLGGKGFTLIIHFIGCQITYPKLEAPLLTEGLIELR